MNDATRGRRLVELAALFLRLGVTAFGGPAAHIAMMQDEVVERRRWMTREEFVDLLGATNLIPGPNSTEMAIHVGHRRAGVLGLAVAGAAFIVPSMLLVGVLAWAYVRFGTRPTAGALMNGIKPVVIAIVAQALWRFRVAVKRVPHALVGIGAAAAAALGVHELVVLAAGGAALVAVEALRRRAPVASLVAPLVPLAPATAIPAVGLAPLFLFFLKVGAVLFGSGYVLFAFIRADLVDRWHWLTDAQLLDAIAIGQLTPGPVSTTATFIGYVLRGAPGALVATAGMFLPAFVFVALSAPLVPRMRRSRWFGALLDGVNVASLALMAIVTVTLARSAIHGVATATLAAAALVVLLATKLNSAWLIAAGAVAGLLLPL